jgi:hypothetical protein
MKNPTGQVVARDSPAPEIVKLDPTGNVQVGILPPEEVEPIGQGLHMNSPADKVKFKL